VFFLFEYLHRSRPYSAAYVPVCFRLENKKPRFLLIESVLCVARKLFRLRNMELRSFVVELNASNAALVSRRHADGVILTQRIDSRGRRRLMSPSAQLCVDTASGGWSVRLHGGSELLMNNSLLISDNELIVLYELKCSDFIFSLYYVSFSVVLKDGNSYYLVFFSIFSVSIRCLCAASGEIKMFNNVDSNLCMYKAAMDNETLLSVIRRIYSSDECCLFHH